MSTANEKKIICFGLLLYLAIYFIVFYLFILKNFLAYADILTGANMILVSLVSAILLGFHRDKGTFLKKEISKTIVIFLLLYFGLGYASGLVFGFLQNPYSLRLYNMINNSLAPAVIVVASEIFRYIVISNNKSNKKIDKLMIFLVTLLLIVVDTSLFLSATSFSSAFGIFKTVTGVLLPSIVKSCTLSYITYHVGYKPGLLYRFCVDLYVFFLPIIPDLSDSVKSMIGILFPLFIYNYSSIVIDEYNGVDEIDIEDNKIDLTTYLFSFTNIVKVAFILVAICLCSGKYSYFLVAIVSGSMENEINIGDAVLVHRVSSDDDISVGDVVAFNNESGTRIVHRVVSKEEREDGIHYTTKGDANPSSDGNDITIDDIRGKVLLKAPYLGYPAMLLQKSNFE